MVLSENWYTWLHVHALSDCIDACVEEIREIFGDKGGDENEVAMGAGDTDLAFQGSLESSEVALPYSLRGFLGTRWYFMIISFQK